MRGRNGWQLALDLDPNSGNVNGLRELAWRTLLQYRLTATIPLQKAIPRIAAGEIGAAMNCLGDAGTGSAGVHAARKHFKKARALLSLIEPVSNGSVAKRSRRRLARAARKLAATRDAEAAVAAAEKLEREYGNGTNAQAFAGLVSFLKARRDRAGEQRQPRQAVIKELKEIRNGVAKLDMADARLADLAGPAAKTFRQGKRGMKTALASGKSEAFHEWRKLAQRHWRQLLLLQEIWPGDAKDRIEKIRRLSDILGQYNDLSVMRETIQANRAAFSSAADMKTLNRVIDAKQGKLKKKAAKWGKRLYCDKPKPLGHKLRARAKKAVQAYAPDRTHASRT
jgi:CHAD domain-containing protein